MVVELVRRCLFCVFVVVLANLMYDTCWLTCGVPNVFLFLVVCTVQSDAQMTCTTEPAVGANHSWTVLVAGQRSVPSSVLSSHQIPIVIVVEGAGIKGGSTVRTCRKSFIKMFPFRGPKFRLRLLIFFFLFFTFFFFYFTTKVGGAVVTIKGDQFGPIPPRNGNGDYAYRIEGNYGRWGEGSWNTDIVPIFTSEPCVMVTA